MNLAEPRTHTDAVIGLLEDAGLLVGDAEAPDGPHGWADAPDSAAFTPYVIVYPLLRTLDGSLGCPYDDADLAWQVTCVGESRAQAEWLEHTVDESLIGSHPTVDDRAVVQVRHDGGAGPRRDDTRQPPTFISTPQYRATSVANPSGS